MFHKSKELGLHFALTFLDDRFPCYLKNALQQYDGLVCKSNHNFGIPMGRGPDHLLVTPEGNHKNRCTYPSVVGQTDMFFHPM